MGLKGKVGAGNLRGKKGVGPGAHFGFEVVREGGGAQLRGTNPFKGLPLRHKGALIFPTKKNGGGTPRARILKKRWGRNHGGG